MQFVKKYSHNKIKATNNYEFRIDLIFTRSILQLELINDNQIDLHASYRSFLYQPLQQRNPYPLF